MSGSPLSVFHFLLCDILPIFLCFYKFSSFFLISPPPLHPHPFLLPCVVTSLSFTSLLPFPHSLSPPLPPLFFFSFLLLLFLICLSSSFHSSSLLLLLSHSKDMFEAIRTEINQCLAAVVYLFSRLTLALELWIICREEKKGRRG